MLALWNDAMAESAADFRDAHPEHRVLLIAGVYHVAKHLGVVTQYVARRPDDSVRVLSAARWCVQRTTSATCSGLGSERA